MIRVLVIAELLIPTLTIGIIRPFIGLEKKNIIELKIKKPGRISNRDIKWCDIGLFCRSQSEKEYTVLLRLKEFNKKIIYDIDDNFFQIPTHTSVGAVHGSSENLFNLEMFLRLSDLVTVYSRGMLDEVKHYNDNVKLLKCYFDDSILASVDKDACTKKVKIAYATGRAPDEQVESNLNLALSRICKKHESEVEIHFWRAPNKMLKNFSCVKQNPTIQNYDSFIKFFYSSGFDIGLAPLVDDVFYNSKTNNKYREYGGCGVAGIYSKVPIYEDCIDDYKNGLLVKGSGANDWFEAIEILIQNQALREKIALSAQVDINKNYRFTEAVKVWSKLLKEINQSNTTDDVTPFHARRDSAILRFPVVNFNVGGVVSNLVLEKLFMIMGKNDCIPLMKVERSFPESCISCCVFSRYSDDLLREVYEKSNKRLPLVLWFSGLSGSDQDRGLTSAAEMKIENAIYVVDTTSEKIRAYFQGDLIVLDIGNNINYSRIGLNSYSYARKMLLELLTRLKASKNLRAKRPLEYITSYSIFSYIDRLLARFRLEILYYKVSILKRL